MDSQVEERARWMDIAGRYGLTLTAMGGSLRGPCPFHRGKNPTSFVITPGKGYHCFACGAGGGVAQFLDRMQGRGSAAPSHSATWPAGEEARPGGATTPVWPLDPAHPYFAARGIHAVTARFFGMGYFHGKPPLGGRIVIPLHNPEGLLVGHVARALDDAEPRYWFQRHVPRKAILFNLHRVKAAKHDTVILVEGAFDAAAVYQLGFTNVVASMGCHVSANQRALPSRFRRVLVLFDDDPSGATAASSLEAELGAAAMRVTLPKADPCTLKGVLLEGILRAALTRSTTPGQDTNGGRPTPTCGRPVS